MLGPCVVFVATTPINESHKKVCLDHWRHLLVSDTCYYISTSPYSFFFFFIVLCAPTRIRVERSFADLITAPARRGSAAHLRLRAWPQAFLRNWTTSVWILPPASQRWLKLTTSECEMTFVSTASVWLKLGFLCMTAFTPRFQTWHRASPSDALKHLLNCQLVTLTTEIQKCIPEGKQVYATKIA